MHLIIIIQKIKKTYICIVDLHKESFTNKLWCLQVDAVFTPRNEIDGLNRTSDINYACSEGAAIMTQKDSKLPDWWNPAFEAVEASGEYARLCNESEEKHGGNYIIIVKL